MTDKENILVAGDGWSQGQHRGSDHNSKRTGLKHKINRGRVYQTRQDVKCRLCKDTIETVQHITAGYKMQAGKAYIGHHNQVAGIVYRNISAKYGLEVLGSK